MNRFKKYCAAKHNLKPAAAYPWLPIEVSKGIVLEDVTHDAEHCIVKEYYNVGTNIVHIARDGSIDCTDFV